MPFPVLPSIGGITRANQVIEPSTMKLIPFWHRMINFAQESIQHQFQQTGLFFGFPEDGLVWTFSLAARACGNLRPGFWMVRVVENQ